MKNTIKTNTFKTLAICLSILSAQALLAKSESRLETTSQVTGCRLQGTGAEMAELPLKDQIRQRTKTTTNCELRTANCDNEGDNLDCHLMMDPAKLKNIEEGIEDVKGVFGFLGKTPSANTQTLVESGSSNGIVSVKRGTESTASTSTLIIGETAEENSTNAFLEQEICNNIYTSCLAKVAKVASMSLAEHTGNNGESIFDFSQEAIEKIAAEQKAKNDVEKRQQKNQAALAFAKTKATQVKEQAATAKVASETTKNKGEHDDVEGDAWRKVVFKLEQASESWNKVSQTLTQGNQKIASLWEKAAEKETVSAEKFEQLALAYALEDEVEAEHLNKTSRIAYHLSNADRWLAESEEALEKGHQDIAEFWRIAAMDDQKAAEYWKQAVEAYALGNAKDGEHYKNIAECIGGSFEYYTNDYTEGSAAYFSKVAEYLTKVAEANAQGNQFLEIFGSKMVIQYKKLAEHYQKGAEVMLNGDSSEIQRWHDRDYRGGGIFDPNWRLGRANNALKKATQAIAIGNESLVALWNQLAIENEKVVELCQKFIEIELNGNDTEIATWRSVMGAADNGTACTLDSAAEALEKATAATARGNHRLAIFWTKTAAQYKKTAETYQKIVEALLNGDTLFNGDNSEADRLQDIAYFNSDSAYMLELAAEAFDKSTEIIVKGNKSLEALWNKAVIKYQESSEYNRNAAKAKLNGDDEETDRWDKASRSTRVSADRSIKVLESTSTALEKATEAIVKGNQCLVELWNKTAIQYQEAAEYYLKSVIIPTWGEGDIETDLWDEIACRSQYHAEVLESAAEAFEKTTAMTAKNNTPLVELWNKTSSQFEKSAVYKQKATEAILSENETEAKHWDKIADSAKDSALALKSAAAVLEEMTTVRVKVNQPLAEILSKKIVQHQKIAKYYQQITEARLSENNTETDYWDRIKSYIESNVDRFKEVDQALEKATQAAAKGKQPLAKRWNKIAVQYQEAVEYGQQVIEAKLSKNKEEVKHWEKIADFAEQSAFRLEQAAEAFEEVMTATAMGNQSLAELWSKTANQYQESAEHYQKVAETRLGGNEAEAERLNEKADTIYKNAKELQKEAEELAKIK